MPHPHHHVRSAIRAAHTVALEAQAAGTRAVRPGRREQSLVITKLEEAALWQQRVDELEGTTYAGDEQERLEQAMRAVHRGIRDAGLAGGSAIASSIRDALAVDLGLVHPAEPAGIAGPEAGPAGQPPAGAQS